LSQLTGGAASTAFGLEGEQRAIPINVHATPATPCSPGSSPCARGASRTSFGCMPEAFVQESLCIQCPRTATQAAHHTTPCARASQAHGQLGHPKVGLAFVSP
jgi:hypothetical protein